MLQELCCILKNKVNAVGFFDRLGGLVSIQEQQETKEGSGTLIKRYPVTADLAAPLPSGCKKHPLTAMVPNSKLECLGYFEGNRIAGTPRRFSFGRVYEADVRLVVWYNRKVKGGTDNAMVNSDLISLITAALEDGRPFNQEGFNRTIVRLAGIMENDAAIFSKYTYSNAERQYLMPPYGYFALDFRVNFVSRHTCTADVQQNLSLC